MLVEGRQTPCPQGIEVMVGVRRRPGLDLGTRCGPGVPDLDILQQLTFLVPGEGCRKVGSSATIGRSDQDSAMERWSVRGCGDSQNRVDRHQTGL